MNRFSAFLVVLTILLASLSAGRSEAAPPALSLIAATSVGQYPFPPAPVAPWVGFDYGWGRFQRQFDGRWIEILHGRPMHMFHEVFRNDMLVELYDPVRRVQVHIRPGRCMWRFIDGPWNPLPAGNLF